MKEKKKYKVHRLNIKLTKEPERLEQFLNSLDGEVVAIIPDVTTVFLCYGAKVRSILVIEKTKN